MKALVTGGAGFIGSHLVEALLKEGNKVTVVDNASGKKFWSIKGAEYKKQCYSNIKLKRNEFDIVYHLAASKNVQESIQNPLKYLKEIEKTACLLEQAEKTKVKKFVFASSSSVYGQQQKFPTGENAPLKPLSPYAVSKIAIEKLCEYYTTVGNLLTVSLRLFNVYGPRCREDVITIFTKNILHGETSEVYGNPSRDFIYIDDVVNAFLKAGEDTSFGAFNIGSGDATKIKEIYSLIASELETKKMAIQKPPRKEPFKTQAKILRAYRVWNWLPKTSLEEGLKETVKALKTGKE